MEKKAFVCLPLLCVVARAVKEEEHRSTRRDGRRTAASTERRSFIFYTSIPRAHHPLQTDTEARGERHYLLSPSGPD